MKWGEREGFWTSQQWKHLLVCGVAEVVVDGADVVEAAREARMMQTSALLLLQAGRLLVQSAHLVSHLQSFEFLPHEFAPLCWTVRRPGRRNSNPSQFCLFREADRQDDLAGTKPLCRVQPRTSSPGAETLSR